MALNIQTELDSGKKYISIPPGTYQIDQPLLVKDYNQVIVGENRFHTIIKQTSPSTDIFQVSAKAGFVEIGNLTFKFTKEPGICINSELSNNLMFYNLFATQHKIGIKLKYCNNVFIRNLQFYGGKESGLWVEGLNDGAQVKPSMEVHLRDFIFDGSVGDGGGYKPPTNLSYGGIYLQGFLDACFFDSGDIVRAVRPLAVVDNDGPPYGVVASPSGCHFSNIYFDSGAIGSILSYCRHSTFHNCGFTNGFASLENYGVNPGLLIENCETLRFTNCHAYDCRGPGVFLRNTSKHTHFINCNFSNNGDRGRASVNGIRVESGTTDFLITECISDQDTYDSQSNQNYGIYIEDGPSDRYIIKNNNLVGNRISGLYDGGTGSSKFVYDNFVDVILSSTPEYRLIRAFYLTFLNREPDTGGIESYVNMLRSELENGLTQTILLCETIVLGFLSSPEYINRARSNSEFVTDLYVGFLQRQPSQNEIDYWVSYLESETNNITRELMPKYFSGSQEFKNYILSFLDVSERCN